MICGRADCLASKGLIAVAGTGRRLVCAFTQHTKATLKDHRFAGFSMAVTRRWDVARNGAVQSRRLGVGGLSMLSPARWAAIIALPAFLAACHSPGGGDVAVVGDPPVFETGMLTSNELSRLGRQQLAAGNAGMAERHFRTAVEKNRNDGPSWLGLAAAYDKLGRFDLADRAYHRAIALRGMDFVIANNMGYSNLLRGDKRQALRSFETALRLDPGNLVVQNNIKLLRSGELPNQAEPL